MARTKIRFGRPKRGSTTKKSIRKAELKLEETSLTKSYKKLPGFDAFITQAVGKGKRKNKRWVACEEATAPETGIHSLQWAAAIVPQQCGFLRLPFEVRLKIYNLVITSFISSQPFICPRKKGNKFQSSNWPQAAQETASLYHVSRQVYVDVVGSGLLYSLKTFVFNSPTLMVNYLWVINPVHRSSIRNIELWIPLNRRNTSLPTKAVAFLGECKSLRYLNLRLLVDPAGSHVLRQWGSYGPVISFKEEFLRKVKEWEAWKSVRGLLGFECKIVFKGRLSPGFEVGFEKFNEELRGIVLEK